MPRQNDATELFRQITAIDHYRIQSGTIFDQLTTGAVAAQATTVPVGATTNATNGDPVFLIGDGGFELNQISGTVATAMPVLNKILFPQSTGARLVEAVKVSLGKIEKGGLSVSPSRSLTAIESATDELPVAFIESALEISATFGLLGFNPENWQLIMGFSEAVTGTGTSADKYQAGFGVPSQAKLSNFAFRGSGIRHDGKNFEIDFLNARIETSGQVQMNRQGEASLPASIKFTQMIFRYWT